MEQFRITEIMDSFDWFAVISIAEGAIKAPLSSSFDPNSPDDQMQGSRTVAWNLRPIEKMDNVEWETQFTEVKTLFREKMILFFVHLVMCIVNILEEDYSVGMIL